MPHPGLDRAEGVLDRAAAQGHRIRITTKPLDGRVDPAIGGSCAWCGWCIRAGLATVYPISPHLNAALFAGAATGQRLAGRTDTDIAFGGGLQMGQAAGDLVSGEGPVIRPLSRTRGGRGLIIDHLELGSPSMATQSPFSTPIRRHRSTNCAQVLRMASPFVRRNSVSVLCSGTSRPVSHITSTSRPASRLSRRLEGMRFR